MWTINRLLAISVVMASVLTSGCGSSPVGGHAQVLPIDPTKVEGTWKVKVTGTLNHSIVNHDSEFVDGTVGQEFVIAKDGFHFPYKGHWPFVDCDQKVFSCDLVAAETLKPFSDHWTSPNLGPLPKSIYHITSKCSDGVFQDYFMSEQLDEIIVNWDGVWMRAKRVK